MKSPPLAEHLNKVLFSTRGKVGARNPSPLLYQAASLTRCIDISASNMILCFTPLYLSPVELSSLEGYVAFPRSRFTMVGEFATFNGVSPLLLS